MKGTSLWFAGVAVLLLTSYAGAQKVFTWRDDRGVVHFSDESPEGVKGVETLTLEQPAPLVSETGEGEGGGEAQISVTPGAGGKAEAPPEDLPQGQAEVVFQGADLSPLGPTQRKVHGKLRNVGGRAAQQISVRVVIADGDTGNLCMTSEINATPTNLNPGDNGIFEGVLDTPCFYGNPKIAYYPEWD